MIRKYKKEDLKVILSILKESSAHLGAWLTTDEAVKSDVENAKVALVCEEEGIIKGFSYMDKLDKRLAYKQVHFYMFVHPDYWWQDIYEKLWIKIKPYLQEENPNITTIAFPYHHVELSIFLKQLGFVTKFYSLRMEYRGPKFNNLILNVRPYNNDDFESYLRIYSEGFYQIRKQYDMKPYLVYTEENYKDEHLRQEILDNSEGLYTFMNEEEIVGFGKIGSFLDIVVVDKKHTNKGYGKDIVRQCTNILIDRNIPVALYVLDLNTRAIKLYKNLGFKVVMPIEALKIT